MKKTISGLLVAALLLSSLGFALMSRLSADELILLATAPNARPAARKLAVAYMRVVGGTRRVGPSDLDPLHFALNGCLHRLQDSPECVQTIELLLRGGSDVNALSNDETQLAPMHAAVLACDPQAIAFLAAHGADVNRAAGGGHFRGATPLRLARELKSPCAGIAAVIDQLKGLGGVE